MNKLLKYSGSLSLLLTVVAFVLLMATPSVNYTVSAFGKSETQSISGIAGIFGGEFSLVKFGCPWAGILTWVLALVAMVILLLGVVFPLLKVKVLDRFAGVLNLVAVVALILGGILAFCEVSALTAANADGFKILSSVGSFGLGAGWIVGGIVMIVAGVCAVLPVIADFKSKK